MAGPIRSPGRASPSPTLAALLASPWRFRRYGYCGMYVSDLFPHVAQCVDDICFVHSVHGTNPAHGGASLKLHTGSDSFVRPSLGSWVTYGLGTENHNLPGLRHHLSHAGSRRTQQLEQRVSAGRVSGHAAGQCQHSFGSGPRPLHSQRPFAGRSAAAAARSPGRDEPRSSGHASGRSLLSKPASTRSSWLFACSATCRRSRIYPAKRRQRAGSMASTIRRPPTSAGNVCSPADSPSAASVSCR